MIADSIIMDAQPSSPPSPSASGGRGGGRRGAATSPRPGNFIGRHRMAAAISQLEQQIDIIKEELEQLETMGESSIACRGLCSSVDSLPDPLLPTTRGPEDSSWERWFRGAHDSRSHKRWIQNYPRLLRNSDV